MSLEDLSETKQSPGETWFKGLILDLEDDGFAGCFTFPKPEGRFCRLSSAVGSWTVEIYADLKTCVIASMQAYSEEPSEVFGSDEATWCDAVSFETSYRTSVDQAKVIGRFIKSVKMLSNIGADKPRKRNND